MIGQLVNSGTLGFGEFARAQGWHPSYVTKLRKADRLVLTADGKRVEVAGSLKRIEETRDPSRPGVNQRGGVSVPASTAEIGQQESPPDDTDEETGSHASRRAKALADKAEADARKALREEQIELGLLRRSDEIDPALAEAGAQFRAALEAMPDDLAPELSAMTDEAEVRARMAEYIETVLGELSRAFADVAKAPA